MMKHPLSALLLAAALTGPVAASALDLARSLAQAGDGPAEIVVDGVADVREPLRIPESVTLKFAPGGRLRVAEGVTVEILGGIDAAPGAWIFEGPGRVAGHPLVPTIRPEWFARGRYNDEDYDWSPAIMKALRLASGGVRHVSLLNRRYNLQHPLLMIPGPGPEDSFAGIVLEGAVRSSQYQLGTLLVGNTGTGKPVIETSDTDGVTLKNLGILRGTKTPGDIGLLQARANRTTWAGDQLHENLFIDMGSEPAANNGFGTIGVANIAAEETKYHNLQVWANLPLLISWTGGESDERLKKLLRTNADLKTDTALVLRSASDLKPTDGYSNTVFALTGLGRLIAYDYVSPVVLINMAGMVDLGHTFLQKRVLHGNAAGKKEGTAGHVYAIEAWNIFQFRHWGSAEGCHGYLLNRRGLYHADVTATIAGHGEKDLPAILLLDDGSDDTLPYHTTLSNARFSIFTYDEERPLVQARDLEGKENPGRFLIRNCEFRTNQPFNPDSAPPENLLARTFGTSWYYADGHIAAGSRTFLPEPGATAKTGQP